MHKIMHILASVLVILTLPASAAFYFTETHGTSKYYSAAAPAVLGLTSFTNNGVNGGGLVLTSTIAADASKPVYVLGADCATSPTPEELRNDDRARPYTSLTATVNHLSPGFTGCVFASLIANGKGSNVIQTGSVTLGGVAEGKNYRPGYYGFVGTLRGKNYNGSQDIGILNQTEWLTNPDKAFVAGLHVILEIVDMTNTFDNDPFTALRMKQILDHAQSEGKTVGWFPRIKYFNAVSEQAARSQYPTEIRNLQADDGLVIWERSNVPGTWFGNMNWLRPNSIAVTKFRNWLIGILQVIGDHPALEYVVLAESAPTGGYGEKIDAEGGGPFSVAGKFQGIRDFVDSVAPYAPKVMFGVGQNSFGINPNTIAKIDEEYAVIEDMMTWSVAKGHAVFTPDAWGREGTTQPKTNVIRYLGTNNIGTRVLAVVTGSQDQGCGKWDNHAQLNTAVSDGPWVFGNCNNGDRYGAPGGDCTMTASHVVLRAVPACSQGVTEATGVAMAKANNGETFNTAGCPTSLPNCNRNL